MPYTQMALPSKLFDFFLASIDWNEHRLPPYLNETKLVNGQRKGEQTPEPTQGHCHHKESALALKGEHFRHSETVPCRISDNKKNVLVHNLIQLQA